MIYPILITYSNCYRRYKDFPFQTIHKFFYLLF